MRVKSKLAGRLAAAGVVVAAIGLPVVSATAAHAVSAPAITVTPSTGLQDGGTVAVAGANFTADEGSTVYVVECSGASEAACNIGAPVPVTVAADGTFSTSFTVHTGTIGNGTCTVGGTNCLIEAGDASQTETAGAPISFSAPPAPAITVTPSKGLSDGDSVTVAGANFTADEGSTVYVVECSGASEAACNIGAPVPVTVAADGTFSTSFTVHTGTIGNGTCTVGGTNCLIEAGDASQTETAAASIGFGPYLTVTPDTNLKAGQTVTVSGADFPANLSLYVLQCGAVAGSAGQGCNTSVLGTPKTDASGAFSGVTIKVVTNPGNQKCDSTHACFIDASNGVKGGPSAAAPITFAKVAVTKVKTTTTAKASAKSVKKGHKFTISGTVKAGKSGVKGLKETLFAGKKKVGSATSGAGGKFTFKLKGAKATTKYSVSTAAKTIGSKAYQASKSKTITVKHKK